MKHLLTTLICLLALTSLAQQELFKFDFAEECKVDLQGSAKIENGSLVLNGKQDFAYVPDSGAMTLTDNGLTFVATVKMNEKGVTAGANDSHDMFLSKGNDFIFGRFTDCIYVNMNNGSDWCAGTMARDCVVSGEWVQYAAVIERFNNRAQGDVGYKVLIYVNGELQHAQRFQEITPQTSDALVEIGRGFGGGPWHFCGEISSVSMYNRSLTPGEIDKLAASDKRIKIVRKGFTEISQNLSELLATEHPSAVVKWVLGALKRAVVSGYDPEIIEFAAKKILDAPMDCNFKDATSILSKGTPFRIVMTDTFAAIAINGKGTGAHPLIGVINRRNAQEIFGEKSITWTIKYQDGNETKELESWDESLRWSSEVSKSGMKISWRSEMFSASSTITFKDARIESNFNVENRSDKIISNVAYPICCFAKLPGGNDRLAYPYMSGVEVKDPTIEQFRWGQLGTYPSASCSMAFAAYYNGKDGIYMGFEDGLARTKDINVFGKRDNLNVSWTSPVAYEAEDPRPNNFSHNGVAVIELYNGNWYEAGQIFRKFLEKNATWWIRDLPRTSTPEWFRDNTMWIQAQTANRESAEDFYRLSRYLRDYFDMPFAIHWYGWEDNQKQKWPHFPAKEFSLEYNRKFQELGISTVPYIDSRLWHNYDDEYETKGLSYAARKPKDDVYTEDYGDKEIFTIMCPAVEDWRMTITDLVQRLAQDGFSGVYHDQVATGAPMLCFSKKHGHMSNDPSLWLEQGYWKMFDSIFNATKDYPEFCHTTEENSDPYLKQFDGYMVWRWTDSEQIPLFQSIYSGRAQFVGRLFNTARPGDKQSFFSKVGQQLVNSEQIGWFNIVEIRDATARRLFVKKAMHTRRALLYWFNEGRMLAPLKFSSMPMEKSKWGGNAPQVLTLPAIANSAWEGPDGSKMYLFVNTQFGKATAMLEQPCSMWVCKEGWDEPQWAADQESVTLDGRGVQVWTSNAKHARAIQAVLKEFKSFDEGQSFLDVSQFKEMKRTAEAGHVYTVREAAGFAGCAPQAQGKYFGWMQGSALISYGDLDFGNASISEVELNLGVDSGYVGGEVSVIANEKILATILLDKTTGGFTEFKPFKIKLSKPITGKTNLIFRIDGNAACNFASWKF